MLLTDAFYNPVTGAGGMGAWLFLPGSGRLLYSYAPAHPWLMAWLASVAPKETYVNQLELIAAVAAYRTYPALLRDRLVHHFIDNQAARSALIKGYSGRRDSAVIVGLMHTTLATLACHPWFGFVYSEDNGSDGPSRGDFQLSQRLGGEFH